MQRGQDTWLMSAFLAGKALPGDLTVHILLLGETMCALGVFGGVHYISWNVPGSKRSLPTVAATFSGP